ncbi:hypothetical protein HanPI659440_Chr03g0128571 [Helianthus annuus]|nr:hypothetical protein HanPI659440_Chr03g0128571 [Helianthus annuus]
MVTADTAMVVIASLLVDRDSTIVILDTVALIAGLTILGIATHPCFTFQLLNTHNIYTSVYQIC